MSTATIHVVRPGLSTTIQDLGRWGHQRSGVPVAGPMDTFSHRLANLLVGNRSDAASLEITLIGPELDFEQPAIVAVCGADFEITCTACAIVSDVVIAVPAGARLRFGDRRTGARAYLAVAGGLQTPIVLGSRATHLVSGMGGLGGRALITGDRLPYEAQPVTDDRLRRDARSQSQRLASSTTPTPRSAAVVRGAPGVDRTRLRVLTGSQATWFEPVATSTLASAAFRVSSRSDRMGYHLEGPLLPRARSDEPISEPTVFGALQVPATGQPILLMADRQTAGGYPKIGTVISADLPLAAQLAPGDQIDFVLCSRQEAAAALIVRERQLLRISDGNDG